jgi:hypothetical protein
MRDEDQGDPRASVEGDVDPPVPVFPLDTRSAWLLRTASGALGQSPLLAQPNGSTPLESDEPEGGVPPSPLWAMKYLRHGRIGSPSGDHESGGIRWSGAGRDGDPGIFVIDDGDDHCMVARLVGASPDGCTYCLVARIKRLDFEDVRAGWAEPTELFSGGKEFTLCGVVEGPVSNVIRVAGYRRYKDVPVEYLPPSGFIDLDGTL